MSRIWGLKVESVLNIERTMIFTVAMDGILYLTENGIRFFEYVINLVLFESDGGPHFSRRISGELSMGSGGALDIEFRKTKGRA